VNPSAHAYFTTKEPGKRNGSQILPLPNMLPSPERLQFQAPGKN
jgi:hypothetical protein